jgi:hypothetical protein
MTDLTLSDPDTILALTLIFCFSFLLIGMKNPIYLVLAGIVWLVSALSVFIDYGQLFLFIGLGVGIITLFEGGMKLAK